jgi:hypothetical protein
MLRPQFSVCQLCASISTRQPSVRPRSLRLATAIRSSRQASTTSRVTAQKARLRTIDANSQKKLAACEPKAPAKSRPLSTESEIPIETELREIQTSVNKITSTKETLPSEKDVEALMKRFGALAARLQAPVRQQVLKQDDSPTSSLLSLGGGLKMRSTPPITGPSPSMQKAADQLSHMAFDLLDHPTVFISPPVLKSYIFLQRSLGNPESLAPILHAYASKPIPIEGTSPPKYKKPSALSISSAIDSIVAGTALQAAIDKKNLSAAMDIVDQTYNTKAFRRAKFIRKALLPVTGLALAPLAAYAVASKLAIYQSTMATDMATNVAFVGIMGYVGFTTIVGVVAITTANDQMERVTWATGMPLRERWTREDERAAIDRIAQAWGFRELWRRGEEEGEEWDIIKDWAGRRGMVLDRADLMEGMN